jgi:hypothetical protein
MLLTVIEGKFQGLIVSCKQTVWADSTHPLGKFVYQTFNQTDFDFFNKHYPYSPRFQLGIGKPNISISNATSGYWDVTMMDLFKRKGNVC